MNNNINKINNKVYETKKRQRARFNKYKKMFSSKYELTIYRMTTKEMMRKKEEINKLKEIINKLPDVLSEIIINYIEDCDSCKQKVCKLYDKTFKYIPTMYLNISEEILRIDHPEWFKDYKVCKECINNMCSYCITIIDNGGYVNGVYICDKCYNNIYDL